MSTLSLAKNGYVSSSKCTKHIKAKYLYIRHFHNSGELSLRYCPTDDMWADILTKPLHGSKFCLFRSFLMNCPENYTEEPPFIPLKPLSPNVLIQPRSSLPKLKLSNPLPWECAAPQLHLLPKYQLTHLYVSYLSPYHSSPRGRMSAGVTPSFHVDTPQPLLPESMFLLGSVTPNS
jgi:hypothetical protein